jgi:hypothetical protein
MHKTMGAAVAVTIAGMVAATTVAMAGMITAVVVAVVTPTRHVLCSHHMALVLLQSLQRGGLFIVRPSTWGCWATRACSLYVPVSVQCLLCSVADACYTTTGVHPVGSIISHRRFEQLGATVPNWLGH